MPYAMQARAPIKSSLSILLRDVSSLSARLSSSRPIIVEQHNNQKTMSEINLQEVLQFAIDLSKEAGKAIVQGSETRFKNASE